MENITFHEKIGEGGFGIVNRVTFKQEYSGYQEGAAKTVFEMSNDEARIMNRLKHPNIVTLIGICKTNTSVIILMEYAQNGSLHDFLSDMTNDTPIELQKQWSTQLASAIRYLHDENLIHRDIKPRNCLLFQDQYLKLGDFGIARSIQRSMSTSVQRGTHRYMAPEIHMGNAEGRALYSTKSDIYAYGMVLYEICTRKTPFAGLEWFRVVFDVGNGIKLDIPEDVPPLFASIMDRCWETEPRRRPSIDDILQELSEGPLDDETTV